MTTASERLTAGATRGDELARRVEALAATEPRWLGELRRSALARALAAPAPRQGEERWRFTELARLDLDGFELGEGERSGVTGAASERSGATESAASERSGVTESAASERDQRELAAVLPSGVELAGLLVLGDGVVVERRLDDAAARAGVILCDLASAAREQRELVERRLAAQVGPADRFSAHNLALHRGAFLHVPPGVELERPLQIVQRTRASASFTRNLAVLGRGARAALISVELRRGPAPSLGVPVDEVSLEEGASLEWTAWRRSAAGTRALALASAELAEAASLAMLAVSEGGELTRVQLDVALAGRGAQAELLGLYAPGGKERVEHWTRQLHRAPATRSNLHYRGALVGESRALYHGTIEVGGEARRTDAYQANRNLLLSPRAAALSSPKLEIAQNDVRCTHGATVGPIDPAALFYLMSRGLPREEATALIARGFLASVLERAPASGLAPAIAEALAAAIARGGEA